MRTLNLRDWTRTPGARSRDQGPFSGEAYAEDVLLPALGTVKEPMPVLLDLDGVAGVPASWLDEVLSRVWDKHGEWDAKVLLSLKYGDDPDDALVRAWMLSDEPWDVARLR